MTITLDPDFPCYDILESSDDGRRFTFHYFPHEEVGFPEATSATVHCYEYSNLRGTFTAKKLAGSKWEAVRTDDK